MTEQLLFLPFARKLTFCENEISIGESNDENNEKYSPSSFDLDFFIKIMDVCGFLGTIKIDNSEYLLFVQHFSLNIDTSTMKVFKIDKIKILNRTKLKKLYSDGKIMNKRLDCQDIIDEITHKDREIKSFLNFFHDSPFYVSHSKIEHDKYLWNQNILNSIDLKNRNGVLFLYSGCFDMKACFHYKYFITSFISSNRFGPRYLSRGVDHEGNVSNFVKTRYFVEREDETVLDVLIYRGSVPIYWDQSGTLRELNFAKKDNFLACFKHFYFNFRNEDFLNSDECFKQSSDDTKNVDLIVEDLDRGNDLTDLMNQSNTNERENAAFMDSINHFNNILVINLLSEKKDEKRLTDFYIDLLDNLKIQNLTFNLNKYHLNYKKLKTLFVDELHQNVMKMQEKMLVRFYKLNQIIFRVNCLDCLDRTNLASYLICEYYHNQLEIPKEHLKALFYENGNKISQFYSGSNALKNELAIKEKRSIKGMMDDLCIFTKRILHDKFNDKQKMEFIDLLLNKVTKTEEIQTLNKNIRTENVLIVTIKIHSKKELKNININPLESTNLIIVCVNKIINNILTIFNQENVNLPISDEFELFQRKTNLNTHILIYTRRSLSHRISSRDSSESKPKIKLPKRNCLISTSFNFDDRKFVIYNGILEKMPKPEQINPNISENNDIFIFTGVFLQDNHNEIFNELDCNYIETRNEIKIGFKGCVSGKDFQEFDSMNFFTFTI